MELLVFSKVLSESGSYLKTNSPILAAGRISVRDEKAPQLMCDSIQPMGRETGEKGAATSAEERGRRGKLYVRMNSASGPEFEMIKKIFNLFLGTDQAVFYFLDTKKQMRASCQLHDALIQELKERLGDENVVLK